MLSSSLARPLLCLCLAAGGLLSTGSAAAADGLTLALAPRGEAAVAQGAPFHFTARITSDHSITQGVFFDLIAPNGAKMTFARQLVAVPPGLPTEISASVIPAQWFKQRGRYQIAASLDRQPAGSPLAFEVRAPTVTAPIFKDVSGPAGVATSLPSATCGRWTNGSAWADVDGDRRLDLLVTRMQAPLQLFLNRGSRFSEESAARGLSTAGYVSLGAVFADYDNDGDADLYVANDGPDLLYRNEGKGTFVNVTAAAGLGDDLSSVSASWGDYDRDGHLDLYVVNHSRCAGNVSLSQLQYHSDHLYHNNGNGTFSDATFLLEHDPSTTLDGSTIGAGFQAAWFDYNDDGRQDLYLANDYLGRSPDRNHLWRNDGLGPSGAWQLTDVSVDSGTSFSMNSMGIGVGDYNRDLKLDLAISNWGANRLLRNNGDGTFSDVAEQTNTARTFQREARRGVTWGPEFADLNNDGWEDLYIAAGYLVGYLTEDDTPQANEVFVNDRKGQFLDLSAVSGADDDGQSRGVAAADYDVDGRVDLYVVNQGGVPHLFRNLTPKGKTHWLDVNTIGTRSNRDGCGTKLILTVAGGKMRRDVYCGGTSVGSGSSKIVHFGVGAAKKLQSLEVTWPSGVKQVFRKLKLDRLVTLTEPRV